MKTILQTIGAAMLVLLVLVVGLFLVSHPDILAIFVGLIIFGLVVYIVRWFIWGQGPPRI